MKTDVVEAPKVIESREYLSGFCNPSNPPDSHARCKPLLQVANRAYYCRCEEPACLDSHFPDPSQRPFQESTAVISEDGQYRYELTRSWVEDGIPLAFIMLNPSTADAHADDPTIRRCMDFAFRHGFDGIQVLNLYALRTTDPRNLWKHPHPIGPENDDRLRDLLEIRSACDLPTVAAWGTNPQPARVKVVQAMPGAESLVALRITKDGAPGHPLYLPSDSPLTPWPAR